MSDRLRDGEVARLALELLCAACDSHEDVRSQDEFGDVGFCGDCLDGARTPIPDAEIGGES